MLSRSDRSELFEIPTLTLSLEVSKRKISSIAVCYESVSKAKTMSFDFSE